jgi:multiple sugar transport system permease protein
MSGAQQWRQRLVLTPLLALSLGFSLLPVIWMIFTSFKTSDVVFGAPGQLLPRVWTLSAYRAVLGDGYFVVYFANSLFVNLSASIATVGLATLAGYSFSRMRMRGKQAVMLGILATQMFPSAVLLIALYVIFRNLGLLDSYASLVLSYVTLGLPFSIWMMRGFAEAVPVDVEEAAMIDGCNRLQALWRVVVPMMLPGMIAVALFSFLVGWNDLVWALTLATSPSMRLIPPGFVATYVGQFQTYWNQLMAGSVLVSLPTVIIFTLLQKYLVQGITSGAVKG